MKRLELPASEYFVVDNEPSAISFLHLIEHKLEKEDSAFYLGNLGMIANALKRWQTHLPRVKPFYAVKSNHDPHVIAMLVSLGLSFDCASETEIQTIQHHHEKCFPNLNSTEAKEYLSKNVIFANPMKIRSHATYAMNAGVRWTTVDSICEIRKLSTVWPNAELIIRVVCPKKFESYVSLGEKYGATKEELDEIIKEAQLHHFNISGISFHVGSGCKDPAAWSETIKYCHEIFNQLRLNGFHPYLLDIGGGFHGPTMVPSALRKKLDIEFELSCTSLNEMLDIYFPREENYEIIAEPGRFLIAGAFALATKVLGSHGFPGDLTDLASQRIYLDSGVYTSFMSVYVGIPAEILAYYQTLSNRKVQMLPVNEKRINATIYGPTCDQKDMIYASKSIHDVEEGDWIVWREMGAYTTCTVTDFNGIVAPKIVYFVFANHLDILPLPLRNHFDENATRICLEEEEKIKINEKEEFVNGLLN